LIPSNCIPTDYISVSIKGFF